MDRPPLSRPPDPAQDAEALVDRLLAAMTAGWQRGERPRAHDLLRPHEWLYAHPEAALRLVYEEICLGEEHGEAATADEVIGHFPQWAEPLGVMLECQRALAPQAEPPRFPEVGEALGDFHILAELGEGAQGRVFLARQASLADRPLVLKATPCEGQEHLSLARLQHTHIVPLYWAQDFPERNLRILCMPFLGVVTLARLQNLLHDTPAAQRTGRDLRRVLDHGRGDLPLALPQGPERERLDALSYVQAVCWIGACLADALHYAHRRGLVHLDLKPSNVLLGADAQPMVLDFHLAHRPVEVGAPAPEWLGGTDDAMSPEQRAAVTAVARGRPIPGPVDGRSDQYSLGLVLYDLLGGQREEGHAPQPQRLPQWNPRVSPGLADVLGRCLAADPRDRYADADALAGDLRRHRDDLPLRGVPNRSVRERWAKWRRRRPHELTVIVAVLLTLGALGAGGVLLAGRLGERRQAADAAFIQGKEQLRRGEYAEAVQTFAQGQEQAAGLLGAEMLRAGLDAHLRLARRAVKVHALHDFTEELRFLSVFDPHALRLRVPVSGFTTLWQERDALLHREGAGLGDQIEHAVRTDLLDLALLSADLRARLAPPDRAEAEHRAALATLAEVESVFGPSAVLCRQQAMHAHALGDIAAARRQEARALAHPPATAWEHYALGRFWLLHDDPAAAVPALERAVALEPRGFLPHFYLGVCAFQRGAYPQAIREFTFCAGAPSHPECFFQRGRAYAAAGDFTAALADFDLALELSRDSKAPPAEVCYQAARAHLARRDRPAARQSVRQALGYDAQHAGARALQKQLGDGD